MDFEFQYLQKNKMLILIFPPLGRKLMSCKWIFKIKYNVNGSMARRKICFVAEEFTQVEGIDFNETFSPIARWNQLELWLVLISMKPFPLLHNGINWSYGCNYNH
jgi:hypothetical protein